MRFSAAACVLLATLPVSDAFVLPANNNNNKVAFVVASPSQKKKENDGAGRRASFGRQRQSKTRKSSSSSPSSSSALFSTTDEELSKLEQQYNSHHVSSGGLDLDGIVKQDIGAFLQEEAQAEVKETKVSQPPKTPAQAAEETRKMSAKYLGEYVGQSGAAAVYSKLQEYGVKVVNGYSGGAVLPLLDQFHQDNPRHAESPEKPLIRWITNSNEASAGYIAEGYAKSVPLSSDPNHLPVGVAIATSGPGVTNLITPLQDAMCDGVPMVVLCGQAATTAPPDAFQSAPAVQLTAPCTKWSYQITSAAEVPLVMDYAFYIATHGRPGPVFVDLPKDLQNQIISQENMQDFVDSNIHDKGTGFIKLSPHYNDETGYFEQVLRMGINAPNMSNNRKLLDGLPFNFVQKGADRVKLEPVSTVNTSPQPQQSQPAAAGAADNNKQDLYHADHFPTNTIHQPSNNDKAKLQADSPLMKELLRLMQRAKKPILLAGQGCNDCSEELLELAETLQIPVCTTLHALGCFDERHPLALNMLGMHGHATPNYLIQESDLVINIGSRFDDRITGKMSDFVPAARAAAAEDRGGIIHVDVRLTERCKQITPTYFVHSTGKRFLRTVNEALSQQASESDRPRKTNTAAWLKYKNELQEKHQVKIPKFQTRTHPQTGQPYTRLSAQRVVQELNQQLMDADKIEDLIVSTGVGVHQMITAQLITWCKPRTMLSSGSLGTMGVALGFAIGGKLANGKRIVIAIDGDGSFNMTFTELKTVAEEGIAVKVLILDNAAQMMVEFWQTLFHDNRLLAVRNEQNPDYCKLAGAFGIESLHCDREEDLPDRISKFIETDKPVILHVKIERTPCLPMVAPGQPLHDMILEDVADREFEGGAAPS